MGTIETATSLIAVVTEARVWLLNLDAATVRHKPTPDRWSIAEVIGHLIDSACNNRQRFIRAQEEDEPTFSKYDQNSWAAKNGCHRSRWTDLVELWYFYNLHLAQVMRAIPNDQLGTPCTIAPSQTCALEFLVTDYLDHLNHHLEKIRERIED